MEQSQDDLTLFKASRALSFGSFILLLWSLLSLGRDGLGGVETLMLPLFAGVALSVHFLGWLGLREACQRTKAMTWTFRASLLGFGIGLVTLPFVPLPSPPGAWVLVPSMFILVGGFAFIPSVYGPVVIAHSVLFLFGSRLVRSRHSLLMLASGILFLIGVAVTAVILQIFLAVNAPFPIVTLAGTTGFGYLLVSTGLWRESTTRRFALQPLV